MKINDTTSNYFVLVDQIRYISNSITSKTIVKKATGTVEVSAFDSGQASAETTSAFDSLIQILEGSAQVVIDARAINVDAGQGVIVPAHRRNFVRANVRFKMLTTVIKSGYEDENMS